MISRFRLTLDAAMMMAARSRHYQEHADLSRRFRCVVWGSSPQCHRNYEMTITETVKADDIDNALYRVHVLAGQVRDHAEQLLSPDDDSLRERHIQLLDSMSGLVETHAIPAVLIGFWSIIVRRQVGRIVPRLALGTSYRR